jgi:carbonic anhydrase/acetyltransferase-like protein (isoleucine patch superfamily)
MAIYSLDGATPDIDPSAYIHPDAVIIGDVRIGAESSVWANAVLRGDFGGKIRIGERSSIQDGTVIHCGPGFPTRIGNGCVVGHLTHLEGCTLEDDSLAGSKSVVLHHAVISSGATVGAGAVVPNKMVVPPLALAVGIPAQIKEGKSNLVIIQLSAAEYVANAKRYRENLQRID